MAGRPTSPRASQAPAQADALRAVIGPVAAAAGLDLEDIAVRRAGSRVLLRVLLDTDGGLTLDAAAAAAQQISEALDGSGVMGERAYVLDVGSPGVDRPLTAARHWRRNIGRTVRVVTTDGRALTGRIVAVAAGADHEAPGTATLDIDGAERIVAGRDIRRAVVQVEFTEGQAED